MGFTDGYKTYDPKKEGYGNPNDWKGAFKERMGFEEARVYLKQSDPHMILGVDKGASLSDIKRRFRELALIWHPDKNPDNVEVATKKMQEIIAAYTILTN